MEWTYKGKECTEIPEGKIGFVYVIHYDDGSYYIGKKNVYSKRVVPALKSTPEDEIVYRIILRCKDGRICKSRIDKKKARSFGMKARKEPYRIINGESNWRSYEGSSDFTKSHTLVAKEIICWCNTKAALTYIEADLQFRLGCLFDPMCLNRNILGKFHRNVLDGEEIEYGIDIQSAI